MNCSKGGRHAYVGGGRRLQVTLKCCWKGTNWDALDHIGVSGKFSMKKGAWAWFHDIWTCGVAVQKFLNIE
jgi:hypothetical protein